MEQTKVLGQEKTEEVSLPIKYCLYARKSSEAEDRQALSIESQIKEMLEIARKDNLEIVEVKKEAHSSKETGQRKIFNQMIEEIKEEKYNGILTWAPDRLSRNAGDLGSIVDLMDQKLLLEIRTYGQKFTDSPNEKFLLMILGSQAKLENDNRGVNVKRGLRTMCERGWRPGTAPTGYLNERHMDRKGQVFPDPQRAPVVKQMFEKVAYEGYSGRMLYFWLKNEVRFVTKNGKPLTLGNVYMILKKPFYYGMFEFPMGSGCWYQGKHKPLISKDVFDLVQTKIAANRANYSTNYKEFAFTKLMKCGHCGSGITAQEKIKRPQNGKEHHYIYYCCTKYYDKKCKCAYMREEALIKQFEELIDKIDIDEIGIRRKIKAEIERHKKFQAGLLGQKSDAKVSDIDIRNYAKYLIREGTTPEKRELMSCFKSQIIFRDKKIFLD